MTGNTAFEGNTAMSFLIIVRKTMVKKVQSNMEKS